jgi:F420-0:gamma-glutamyl ligase-like protein
MSTGERYIEPGSEIDLAIERALQGANLRAGDAVGASTASVTEDWEPSAAESGDAVGGADGD